MNDAAGAGSHKQLFLIVVWLVLLTLYALVTTQRPEYTGDAWSTERAGDSTRSLLSRIRALPTSRTTVHLVEMRAVGDDLVGSYQLRETFVNEMPLSLPDSLRLSMTRAHSETFDRLMAMKANQDYLRFGVFLPNLKYARVLKYASQAVIIASWVTLIATLLIMVLCMYPPPIEALRLDASLWTVVGVSAIGILHGGFVLVQGGLIVSPIGLVLSAVIPFIVAKSLIARPPGGVREYLLSRAFIPVAVTVSAAGIAEFFARMLSSTATRSVHGQLFEVWYMPVYVVTILFGAASVGFQLAGRQIHAEATAPGHTKTRLARDGELAPAADS